MRDLGLLESAVAQPKQSFGGSDLYPEIHQKAAALGFLLIANHPFVDGNKRVGHAALESFLMLNGHQLQAEVDDLERVITAVASGQLSRESFADWVVEQMEPLED